MKEILEKIKKIKTFKKYMKQQKEKRERENWKDISIQVLYAKENEKKNIKTVKKYKRRE